MKKIYPKLLKKGDTIGITSLTWRVDPSLMYEGEKTLNTLGFEVDIHENASLRDGQMAGTEKQRLQGFYELLEDPLIHAVHFIRGGYGSLQLLDLLDFKRIAKQKKQLMGYSDLTAFLNAVYAKTGLITFHGPMIVKIDQFNQPKTQKSFLDQCVKGNKNILLEGDIITKGCAEGTLVGGNMTVFDQLIGTPYFPKDKKLILMLEETSGEEINELDKKLLHLKHAGILPRIKGIILSEMHKLRDNDTPFGYSAKELIHKYLPHCPAIENVTCGHFDEIITLPIGATVKLTVEGVQGNLDIL